MLMSMANGRSFEAIRMEPPRLEYEDYLEGFLDQIVDIITKLSSHSWNHVGGLEEITSNAEDGGGKRDAENRSMIVPGPVVDETMWQVPELDIFWANCSSEFEHLRLRHTYSEFGSHTLVTGINRELPVESQLKLFPIFNK